ncbi:hypothetical protein PRIPAC_80449 [Pristionchus pacificus]|uniref:Cysteine synthase n=1 Tax=Pristionchus pacificus TaxID=54126 RepID=A0A2A6CNG9_PRIPA|nr:hypothetical protein PRIPAC_80449 [Pristionchus pacificus]|eukprot:PDM79603.1 hypothetical protein PRIPAC_32182 [Pristionchus pacificus]
MDEIHSTAAGAIGNTPLVMLNHISKDLPARIAVKLEYMNPTCSVKDRAAKAMIDDAEAKGLITPGKTVLLDSTSGNMGISLAFYAKIKGYKVVIIMPSVASIERRALIVALGAELIIVDPTVRGKAMLERARLVAESHPDIHWLNQFDNSANVAAHHRTTGPEIWRQSKGKVDIVCFGVGSGGTVTGVGKYLREQKKEVEVYAMEPYESSVISGLPAGQHYIQGIGAGIVPNILDQAQLNGIIRVKSDEALEMARRLATEESILGGITSGANVVAAVELAKKPENAGKLIVTTVNSSGERYL